MYILKWKNWIIKTDFFLCIERHLIDCCSMFNVVPLEGTMVVFFEDVFYALGKE